MYSKDGFVICILFSWEVHLIKSLKSQSLWPKVWNRWGHVIQDITRPLHGAHYQDVGSSIAGIPPHVHLVKRWHTSPHTFLTSKPSTMPQTCLLLHSHGVRDSAKTAMCHSASAFRGHWSRQMSGQLEEMTDFLWCFHVFVKHPWFWAITKPGKLRSKSHLITLDFL